MIKYICAIFSVKSAAQKSAALLRTDKHQGLEQNNAVPYNVPFFNLCSAFGGAAGA
jgi:hypothetical protein